MKILEGKAKPSATQPNAIIGAAAQPRSIADVLASAERLGCAITQSPVLAFQAWAVERSATRGPMTQDEYFLAQEAFFAAHPGKGPTSSTMVPPAEGDA